MAVGNNIDKLTYRNGTYVPEALVEACRAHEDRVPVYIRTLLDDQRPMPRAIS